jgi:DNA polymerase-3 subunit epsilon
MRVPTYNPADCFVAIDFETANSSRDSACAVALITVRGTEIVDRTSFLIKPPQPEFEFCHIHGICREHVADQPAFGELWPQILARLEPAAFIAAHNAAFDRAVLLACCETNGLIPPPLSFLCTLQMARAAPWRLNPANLPAVCQFLSIPLDHHRAESDAEACARIVIAARQTGIELDRFIQRPDSSGGSPAPGVIAAPPPVRAIVAQLDRLGELKSQRDGLAAEKEARIDQAVTPEVKAVLAAIDAEFTHKEEGLRVDIEALEAEVKAGVLGYGETVRGKYLSAQWVSGRITWDRRGLDGYGRQHPEVLQFRREGSPSVRLQPLRRGNQEPEDAG